MFEVTEITDIVTSNVPPLMASVVTSFNFLNTQCLFKRSSVALAKVAVEKLRRGTFLLEVPVTMEENEPIFAFI